MAVITGFFGLLIGYILPFLVVISLIVFIHEMGHYLGVHHPSGKKSQTNIMSTQALFDPFSGALSDPVFTDLVFSQDQIENMQSALSRNPARRADRRK